MRFRRFRRWSVRILDFYNFFIDFDGNRRRNRFCSEKENGAIITPWSGEKSGVKWKGVTVCVGRLVKGLTLVYFGLILVFLGLYGLKLDYLAYLSLR